MTGPVVHPDARAFLDRKPVVYRLMRYLYLTPGSEDRENMLYGLYQTLEGAKIEAHRLALHNQQFHPDFDGGMIAWRKWNTIWDGFLRHPDNPRDRQRQVFEIIADEVHP